MLLGKNKIVYLEILRRFLYTIYPVLRKDSGEAVGISAVIVSLHYVDAEVLTRRENFDRNTAAESHINYRNKTINDNRLIFVENVIKDIY